jgi:hypothetical protein
LPTALVLTVVSLELARKDGGSAVVAGVLAAALPWLRPEGLVIVAPLLLLSELPTLRALGDPTRRSAAVRRLLLLAALPILSQLVLEAVRFAVYGNFIPNPVLIKVGTGEVGVVTFRFLRQVAPIVPVAVAGVLALKGRTRLLAVPVVVYLVGSWTAANEVNMFSRFFLPAWPLIVLLAAGALARVADAMHTRWSEVAGEASMVALAGTLAFLVPANSWNNAIHHATTYVECREAPRVDAGRWLNERLGEGDVYGTHDGGLIPFLAGAEAIDTAGLNDPALPEAGTLSPDVRAERALARTPRFFVIASARLDELRPRYSVDKALVELDGFSEYEERATFGYEGCNYNIYIMEFTGAS